MATKTSNKQDEEIEVKKPKRYKVIYLNDDFTTIEFVVLSLMRIFLKSYDEASKIANLVHTTGKGIAGVYTKEIAETKASQVVLLAKSMGHPLQVVAEPE